MELAEMADRILLVGPVHPFTFLAKTALKLMADLYKEAIVCLTELEAIASAAVCIFDLSKVQISNECFQRHPILKCYHDPVDCKVAPSTALAMFLQFERITSIRHSGFLARPIIRPCFLHHLIRVSMRRGGRSLRDVGAVLRMQKVVRKEAKVGDVTGTRSSKRDYLWKSIGL